MAKNATLEKLPEYFEILCVNVEKITKIVATRCQILRLKCTKFDFSWGSAPDPTGGASSFFFFALRRDSGSIDVDPSDVANITPNST